MEDLKAKFHEVDSVVNELKDGYLIQQEGKSYYKLNPYFFEAI